MLCIDNITSTDVLVKFSVLIRHSNFQLTSNYDNGCFTVSLPFVTVYFAKLIMMISDEQIRVEIRFSSVCHDSSGT